MQVSASIFKAYDIRGVVPSTLTADIARGLGRAFGTRARQLGSHTVAVGRDGRLSSPALASLTVIAIGAGAMTVSHANDSYFWVVTNFGGMSTQDGYKTQTLGTLVVGIASMVGVMIVSLFLH